MQTEADIIVEYANSDGYGKVNIICRNSRVRLNEEDLRLLTALGQKLYVRYDEGEILYSMGRNSFMKAAKEAHATKKVKGIVLVNTKIFNEYLEMCEEDI